MRGILKIRTTWGRACNPAGAVHHSAMMDFLTFKSFITPGVLVVCYYAGVLFMPFLAAYLWKKLGQLGTASENRSKKIAATVALVFMLELVWRMMFEAMVAYFQMRAALVALAGP
jgi:hypothetical protein